VLCDVAPDGRATLISEGIAALDTSAGPAAATVALADVAYRLAPGHALRLALSGSRFPRYVAHPGTGENLWTATEQRPARQSVTIGGPSGARLRLTVADDA
jgi:predicted acyl esterase